MERRLADSLDVLQFPKDVYTTLIEFAILYLQEMPKNIGEFGTLFFEKKYQRSSGVGTSQQSDSLSGSRILKSKPSVSLTAEEIEQGLALLSNIGIFKHLTPKEKSSLATNLVRIEKKNGDTVFQEGTDVRGIYLVENGKIKLISTKLPPPKKVVNMGKTILEKGDYTDILSLICYKPSEFSAYAIGEVSVFYLSVESFESVVGSCSLFLHRAYQPKEWENYIQGNPYLYILRYEMRNFIICYLTQRPTNFLLFGMIYFNEMRKNPGNVGFLNMGKNEEKKDSKNRVVNLALTGFPKHPKTEDEKRLIRDTISNVLIFKSLGKEQVNTIVDALEKKEVKAGEIIIQQGEESEFFYIIDSGKCQAYVTDDESFKNLKTYQRWGSFGEMNMLYENTLKYPNTIKAVTQSSLWTLPRHVYKKVVQSKFFENMIERVPHLRPLRPEDKRKIVYAFELRKFKNGQAIIKENEIGDGMYFVMSGQVFIKKLIKGVNTVQAIVRKGGHFGETALVTKHRRTTSAYAVGDVEVAFLDITTFQHVVSPQKQLLIKHIDMYERQILNIMSKLGVEN